MPSYIRTYATGGSISEPATPLLKGKTVIENTRNIKEVVLGEVAFDTAYGSRYDPVTINTKKEVHANGDDDFILSSSSTEDICQRLYVCPYCFRHTPVASSYLAHLKYHENDKDEQGRIRAVPASSEKVYEHDGYTVWEVAGEQERLYCQNLSLFAKLWLAEKSVVFDVSPFKFYVLTYTTPVPIGRSKPSRNRISDPLPSFDLSTKVLGFFSKEIHPWDANNLACILIFPPYQRRQYGKLLMSVSYKLSAWEWVNGSIGGPEKPLSEMGRKSYHRFWAERIARYLLGESADADGNRVFDKFKKRKNSMLKDEMSIEEIGERTGMLLDDVVSALQYIGGCEVMPKKRKKSDIPEEEEEDVIRMSLKRSTIQAWVRDNQIDVRDPAYEVGYQGEWASSERSDAGGGGDSERVRSDSERS